jgi:amino acid transporter
VLKGVSAVFFAYIGFDAITTTAEECKNPKRDLPLGMFYSLAICTVLYITIALVLTGHGEPREAAGGDPLAFVFGPQGANLPWLRAAVAISAVVAMTTVLLVFQLGPAAHLDVHEPRWSAAAHLLGHPPRFKTPWFATLITGLLVAVPALFMNLTEVTDLTSIGTLFAFVLVSGGVLLLDGGGRGGRYTPYISSRWLIPVAYVGVWFYAIVYQHDALMRWLSFTDPDDPSVHGWEIFKHQIPLIVFIIGSGVFAVLCFVKRLSLIPVMGVLTCAYLMTELGITNWIRFLIWLVIGLVLYFVYGVRHSKLNKPA